jgi:hypothetical protein
MSDPAEDRPADDGPEASTAQWQDFEARWNAILALEGSTDTLRLTIEAARVELENAWNKSLTPEEKLNATRADVAQLQKAKNRVHFTLPKVREFVHRATWAMGLPERKSLQELFENPDGPDASVLDAQKVSEQLEILLKNRQILAAQGATINQECKNVLMDIQGALRTLQNNAAANAQRKRDANRAGGKFFKDVRRWSMGGK